MSLYSSIKKCLLIVLILGLYSTLTNAQNSKFEKGLEAYYRYEYNKSIRLFEEFKSQSEDQKLELKANAFIAISNIYLGEYSKAIDGLNEGFNKSSNTYGESSLEVSDFYLGFGKYYEILEVYDTALIFNNAALVLKQSYLPNDHQDFIDVYVNIGIAYDYSGQYDSAIVHYEKGLNATIKNLGEIHPYTEYLYNDLGVVYGFVEKHDKALLMAQKALRVRSQLYGSSSAEVAQSYHNIGVSMDALNRFDEALPKYQKAFDLKSDLYSKESKEIAAAYYSLGNSYSRNNLFPKAIQYNQKAFEIVNTLLGGNHSLTLKYLKNLGNVSFDGGMYQKAIEYYSDYIQRTSETEVSRQELSEALLYIGQAYENIGDYKAAEENFNQALDKSKDDDAIVYNVLISLARIRDLQSNYKEALRLLSEALKITGTDSGEAGFIYNNLANVLINMSQFNEAKLNLDKSLKIREKYFGKESNEVSQTYSTYGKYYDGLEKYEKSLEYYQKAYDIKKKSYPENHPILNSALFNLSAARGNNNDFNKEVEFLNRVLKTNQSNYGLGYSGNASIYQNLSLNYDKQGKINEALDNGKKAAEMNAQNYGEQSEQTADALASLSTIQHNFGQTKESLKNAQRALLFYESLFGTEHVKTANQLNNIGVIYMETHEYEKSKSYFNQALQSYKLIFGEGSSYVTSTLSNLALIEYERNEYESAIELFIEAVQLGHNLEDSYLPKQANTVQNLGLCYSLNRQPDKAIVNFRKAIRIKKDVLGSKNHEVGDIMVNIGNFHLKQYSFDSAEYYFDGALAIYKSHFGIKGERVTGAYNNLAELSLKRKDYQKALWFNKLAIESNIIEGVVNSFGQAFVSQVTASDINYSLYKRTKERSHLDNAYQSTLEADKLLLNAESELFREDDKLSFSVYKTLLTNISIKNTKELYELTNDIQYMDKALYFAERSKSGVLLSALKLSNVKQFKGVDNDIIAKEKSLEQAIQLVNEELFKLGDQSEEQRISGLKSKRFELNRELESLKKIEQQRFPKHYNMNQNALVDLTQLRSDLSNRTNAAFIEYAISDSTLHAIVVTNNEQTVISSPLDEKFENKLNAFRKAVMFKADNVLNLVSEEIYKVVFVQIEEFFAEKDLTIDEVIIVPEGALNYLPFEALFRNRDGKHQYLIEDYAVAYTYSLSLYDFINNRQKTATDNACLAFAPVFSESSSTASMNDEAKDLFASASDVMTDVSRAFTRNGSFISALPGTEYEVKEIHQMAQSSGLSSKYFIHEKAEESVLKSGILKDYKYLHFATHGFINEHKPAFSGILMSQNQGSEEDCILYASEIYNLEVNADLVTLSACETGLGKMAFGEGIVGLTRSFLYAGASNLLVSQWKVNDESTSKMMVDFYDQIFSGKSKTQALRDAKLAILKNEKFKNPYYWAPFVLIGQ